jgi:glyoxylase-like metal-dependent hydrolase (beta-lactamase superfamily II)
MAETHPKITWHPIPPSAATCKVYLIQAGGLYIPYDLVMLPDSDKAQPPSEPEASKEERKTYYAPDYVFLIEHTASGTKYMFDLGIRPDLENLPPLIQETVLPIFKSEPKSPEKILREHGSSEQQPENIKAVIFSHMHFDHMGDGAKGGFEGAELWVGPTCCTYARPGYPADEKAPTLSDALPVDGSRKIVESYIPDDLLRDAGDKRAGQVMEGMKEGKYAAVDLKNSEWIRLGAFDRAYDVFGDGAAYIIDAPGHSAGHQMMLVRTTSGSGDKESTFVLLGGDCFHHVDILKHPSRTARPPYVQLCMHSDPEQAVENMFRTREFARKDYVWVIGAHDATVGERIKPGVKELEGLVDITAWQEKGWKEAI